MISIMMFEVFTIFVPVFQVMRLDAIARRAIESNTKWETASQATTCRLSTFSMLDQGSLESLPDVGDRLLTIKALDHVLRENPQPLQEFSALSDFCGENIAFLTQVSDWKAVWDGTGRLEAFNRALDIYIDFVSLRDAEFPLNLSSPDLKKLEDAFEQSVRSVHGEAYINPATPFESILPTRRTRAPYVGMVPEDFDGSVFDAAQDHIKYLVFTNTWPKFVAEMQGRRSSDTEHSEYSTDSDATLTSRLSRSMSMFFRSVKGSKIM